jgi:hypothetical protein
MTLMPMAPQDVADVLNAAGIDAPALAQFLADAQKPVRRAAVQQLIDDENDAYAALTKAHNDRLAELQAQLNAI